MSCSFYSLWVATHFDYSWSSFNDNIIIMLLDRSVDICVTKTTEGYTPLHLVARFNPYDNYESAEEEVDSDRDGGQRGYCSHTPAYESQTSSKQAMEFLIAKNVDVR